MAYTTIDKPTDYFNTVTWTGDGSASRNITGIGFKPDWVWVKCRNSAVSHAVYDSVRGASKLINTNTSSAEGTNPAVNAFISDGFTVNSDSYVNLNSNTYVAWNFLASNTTASNTDGSITSTVSANTTSGFSIATYTGNGSSGSTIGHGLNAVPEVVLIRRRNQATDWNFQLGYSQYLKLNSTDQAIATSGGLVGSGSTSTITVDANGYVNASGSTYVGYFFVSKKGYSKFGSYTGNGNADGTFVYTGFKPAFVMWKKTNGASEWIMVDSKRNTSNEVDKLLRANQSSAENTYGACDFLSNGWKFRDGDTDFQASGDTYIYMAFAENPFVTSTGVPACAR